MENPAVDKHFIAITDQVNYVLFKLWQRPVHHGHLTWGHGGQRLCSPLDKRSELPMPAED
ncbi:hypothetical protein D3C73_1319460 [compost metagenome]